MPLVTENPNLNNFTRRDYRILSQLKTMAEDTEPVANARLAACVVVKGSPVSFGRNSLKSHGFQMRYGKNVDSKFWHAETNAIYNALKRVHVEDLQRATLYVVRVKRPESLSRDWILANSKPCSGCMKCITDFGIGRILYSIDGGFVCDGG